MARTYFNLSQVTLAIHPDHTLPPGTSGPGDPALAAPLADASLIVLLPDSSPEPPAAKKPSKAAATPATPAAATTAAAPSPADAGQTKEPTK